MKWEYLVEDMNGIINAVSHSKSYGLNLEGKDEWELITVYKEYAIFKRPVVVDQSRFKNKIMNIIKRNLHYFIDKDNRRINYD